MLKRTIAIQCNCRAALARVRWWGIVDYPPPACARKRRASVQVLEQPRSSIMHLHSRAKMLAKIGKQKTLSGFYERITHMGAFGAKTLKPRTSQRGRIAI
eukprot:8296484-Alexandrium_andersonii.AAC.1